MKSSFLYLLLVPFTLLSSNMTFAQNPFIMDQFTADPTARVFGDRVFVYPSHDIPCTEDHGRIGWFCMADYHVFSSPNLTDWTDHGVIVDQKNVEWANPEGYSMWAPDCIFRNGKYYFYFPTFVGDTVKYGRGFGIGVAIADKPEGPYKPEPGPILNVHGIDPNVFIDKDGQAYLYWAIGHIFAARLKENMTELDSEPVIIGDLPDEGLKEGPFLFERNGLYYMTYPHVGNRTERLEYAVGDNPLGPFEVTGVIMDESPTGCWTNHHSLIEFKGQWYLFYHHNDLSPNFDKNRSIRVDSLFFNEDGTIQKVIPTLRGVGLTNATKKIQIDRYSQKSEQGVSIEFLDEQDTVNRSEGWKTIFDSKDAWIQYNSVDFGTKALKKVKVKALSETGGTVQIRLNSLMGPMLAEIDVPGGGQWKTVSAPVTLFRPGIHNLFVMPKDQSAVEIDWLNFE